MMERNAKILARDALIVNVEYTKTECVPAESFHRMTGRVFTCLLSCRGSPHVAPMPGKEALVFCVLGPQGQSLDGTWPSFSPRVIATSWIHARASHALLRVGPR